MPKSKLNGGKILICGFLLSVLVSLIYTQLDAEARSRRVVVNFSCDESGGGKFTFSAPHKRQVSVRVQEFSVYEVVNERFTAETLRWKIVHKKRKSEELTSVIYGVASIEFETAISPAKLFHGKKYIAIVNGAGERGGVEFSSCGLKLVSP